MKGKGTAPGRRAVFLGITCLFCAMIVAAFFCYNRYQERQFEVLEHQNLIAEARWQSQQVRAELTKLLAQLEAAADMVVSSGLSPEDAWLREYLDQISEEESYSITYAPIGELFRELGREDTPASSQETYRWLLDGRTVVSEILHSTRLQGYYFAIGKPVRREGETIGVLRCVVPAGMLLQKERGTAERTPFLQCVVDRTGRILYSSGGEDLQGRDILTWLEEQGTGGTVGDTLRQALESGTCDAMTLRERRWTMTTAPLFSRQGWNLVQLAQAGSYQAVSDRLLGSTILISALLVLLTMGISLALFRLLRGQSRRLELEQQKFFSLAPMFGALFFEYDRQADTLTLSASEQCCFAIRTGVIKKCRRHTFSGVYPEDVGTVRQAMEELRAPVTMELRLLDKAGAWRWCECQVRPLLLDERQVALAGCITDINERKLRELRLLEENATDALTGLLNRASVQQTVDGLIAGSAKGFLFMCDLDNFKTVNDSQGHAAGDRLLRQVAEILRSCFRGNDPVARQGGDEFVVYMADTADRVLAAAKAEQILRKFAQFSQQNQLPISVSVGIACCPEDGGSFEELYRRADTAMYQAKKQGKQSVCFYRQDG